MSSRKDFATSHEPRAAAAQRQNCHVFLAFYVDSHRESFGKKKKTSPFGQRWGKSVGHFSTARFPTGPAEPRRNLLVPNNLSVACVAQGFCSTAFQGHSRHLPQHASCLPFLPIGAARSGHKPLYSDRYFHLGHTRGLSYEQHPWRPTRSRMDHPRYAYTS